MHTNSDRATKRLQRDHTAKRWRAENLINKHKVAKKNWKQIILGMTDPIHYI